jgi:2-polyprenyl-3-methyl-5-hydroxy-6-metoxy-1,4-benzoquinol methylase
MRKIDLKTLMQSLYETGNYFASIDPESTDYEENYHMIAIDPDGKERKLLEEREHSLSATKEIAAFLSNIKPGKILDIGCGPGWILSSLSNEWDKHGIEISQFASNHASKFGKIHCGTLNNYYENDFDVVIMNHVIEHIPDPIFAINKIYSMLKKGGKLIIGTPDFDSGAARRYGSNFRLLHDPTHVSLFSLDSMHRFLRDFGFKIKYVEYPFFETVWFNKNDLLKMLDDTTISPPFYGSAMTFLCEKI